MSVIALLLTATLAQTPPSVPAPATPPVATSSASAERTWGFGFDRVDLLSEAPGTFLHWDAPLFATGPLDKTLRFLEQVTVVWRLPWQGFHMNLSLGTQSLTYEHPLVAGLFVTGGLQTRLLFPSGANVGVAYRLGILRVGLSASMTTSGSWAAPGVFAPQFLPALGLGIGLP